MAAFHLWEVVLVLCTLAGHDVISFTCAFPARKIQIVCCEKGSLCHFEKYGHV